MELEFARNLTRLERLSPKLQKLLFNINDDVVNYYLASRDDLLVDIQKILVNNGKFLEQWAKGRNREILLINKVLQEHQYEEVALALVEQKNLDCFSVEELLNYENWLIAWRLLQLEKLCPEHKLVALEQVISSISLTSNDKLIEEVVTYLNDERDLWILAFEIANLDQLYLLTKIPSYMISLLTPELEVVVTRLLMEWEELLAKNYYWNINISVDEELVEGKRNFKINDSITHTKIKTAYEKLLKLIMGNLSHTPNITKIVAKSELSFPYLKEIALWENIIKLRRKLLVEPKKEDELFYLKEVELYPYFKGNDIFVSRLAFANKSELSEGFYIQATTMTTNEILNEMIDNFLDDKEYGLLEILLERYPEARVQSVLFLDFLLSVKSPKVLEEGIFKGLEEYLIQKSEDLSLLVRNEILLEKILFYIDKESELISGTMLNLLPEWVCSMQGLKDFANEVNQ